MAVATRTVLALLEEKAKPISPTLLPPCTIPLQTILGLGRESYSGSKQGLFEKAVALPSRSSGLYLKPGGSLH